MVTNFGTWEQRLNRLSCGLIHILHATATERQKEVNRFHATICWLHWDVKHTLGGAIWSMTGSGRHDLWNEGYLGLLELGSVHIGTSSRKNIPALRSMYKPALCCPFINPGDMMMLHQSRRHTTLSYVRLGNSRLCCPSIYVDSERQISQAINLQRSLRRAIGFSRFRSYPHMDLRLFASPSKHPWYLWTYAESSSHALSFDGQLIADHLVAWVRLYVHTETSAQHIRGILTYCHY